MDTKPIARVGIGCLQVRSLRPNPTDSKKRVGGSASSLSVVALVATNADCSTPLARCTDDDRIAVDRDRRAKAIGGAGVGGLQVRLVGPRRSVAGVDEDRPACRRAVVGPIAVDASRRTVFTARPDELAASRAEWARANPERMQEYRDWFLETFNTEPPGIRTN